MNISVSVIGFYRDIVKKPKIALEIIPKADKALTVFDVLEDLCVTYGDEFRNLLFKDDGSLDDWSRVMLNGRDIRFLSPEKLALNDEDSLLIMSVLAGG